jgi:hypothetical protein
MDLKINSTVKKPSLRIPMPYFNLRRLQISNNKANGTVLDRKDSAAVIQLIFWLHDLYCPTRLPLPPNVKFAIRLSELQLWCLGWFSALLVSCTSLHGDGEHVS